MYRVTIVSADRALTENLRQPLRAAGYDVVVWSGAEEVEPDPAAAPDILALDWRDQAAPARSPFAEAWPNALVLAVVTPSQLADLDPAQMVEDFIVPPVHPEEFVARVRQALWRSRGAKPQNLLVAGGLSLDLASYQVSAAGRPITLTYKEYELLRFLMTHAGTVFKRDTLLNRVWGYDYYGGGRTVDVHIRRLRSKLPPTSAGYIETVRNVGYRFAQPLR